MKKRLWSHESNVLTTRLPSQTLKRPSIRRMRSYINVFIISLMLLICQML